MMNRYPNGKLVRALPQASTRRKRNYNIAHEFTDRHEGSALPNAEPQPAGRDAKGITDPGHPREQQDRAAVSLYALQRSLDLRR